MRIGLLLCIVVMLLGCNKTGTIYNNIVFIDGQFKVLNDSFDEDFEELYDGSHNLCVDGRLYKTGVYENGVMKGPWSYFSNDSTQIDVNWKHDTTVWDRVKLSVPDSWSSFTEAELPKIVVYNVNPNLDRETITNDYFMILVHDKYKDKSLEEFNIIYNQKASKYNIQNSDHYLITIDGQKYFINRYLELEDGKKVLSYVMLAKWGDSFLDVILNKADDNQVKTGIQFFEMLRSIQIDGISIFPHVGSIELKKLN
ncbi:hypothetical protein EYV94_28140 [Puteibacter caeruleilacunae]|nr:hypothetical protein EYV94_28140 [Puteibacter caeruleilacunae]